MDGHHYILEIFPSLLGIKFNFLPIFVTSNIQKNNGVIKGVIQDRKWSFE